MKRRKSEPQDTVFIEEVSVEREIAEVQLERLRMISRDRLLTYEETKVYDLLTKNLLLSKGKATDIVAKPIKSETTKKITTEQLIDIVKEPVEEAIKSSLMVVDSDVKEGN